MNAKNHYSVFPSILCCIICIFCTLTSKADNSDASSGLSVFYPRMAYTGQEVIFSFTTKKDIRRIQVFVNGSRLGSVNVENQKAMFRFKFAYASIKKLTFVGVNAQKESFGLSGEITINNKNFVNLVHNNKIPTELLELVNNKDDKPKDEKEKSKEEPEPAKEENNDKSAFVSDANTPVGNKNASKYYFPPTPDEDPVNGLNQNVYATAVGHPSNSEINTFMKEIEPTVLKFARKYNLPASVIMAMAILESGYGYSRTAIFANNFFGIKQWKKGSDAYQLKGQPNEDKGYLKITKKTTTGQFIYEENTRKDNWYKKFSSKDECIKFLVEEVFLHKTGQWKRDYSNVVRNYQRQIQSGVSKSNAAYDFAFMLGERGYNHLGGKYYATKTMKIIEKYNLLQLDQGRL